MEYQIFVCEDSLDGIFTAVYDAWAYGSPHAYNIIQCENSDQEQQLFATYHKVETDIQKAAKVARTVKNKISALLYQTILQASTSFNPNKAQCIYKSIVLGLSVGASVVDHQADPDINLLFKLSLNVVREVLHYKGFVRFEELENGVLFSRIRPKNSILPFLAEHFSDRFPDENFIIIDTGRNHVIFHGKHQQYKYAQMTDFELENLTAKRSESEQWMQDLWHLFVTTIGIEARHNVNLQKQMLPLRFREYMHEMNNPGTKN
jgi:probable DNA metabolism protein